MPINYKNYAPNWLSEIRPAILERAKNKCEMCGVENFAVLNPLLKIQFNGFLSYKVANEFKKQIEKTENIKLSIVVLTVAHLDHSTTNNDFTNLKALCQRCHLNHDKAQHKASR